MDSPEVRNRGVGQIEGTRGVGAAIPGGLRPQQAGIRSPALTQGYFRRALATGHPPAPGWARF